MATERLARFFGLGLLTRPAPVRRPPARVPPTSAPPVEPELPSLEAELARLDAGGEAIPPTA